MQQTPVAETLYLLLTHDSTIPLPARPLYVFSRTSERIKSHDIETKRSA